MCMDACACCACMWHVHAVHVHVHGMQHACACSCMYVCCACACRVMVSMLCQVTSSAGRVVLTRIFGEVLELEGGEGDVVAPSARLRLGGEQIDNEDGAMGCASEAVQPHVGAAVPATWQHGVVRRGGRGWGPMGCERWGVLSQIGDADGDRVPFGRVDWRRDVGDIADEDLVRSGRPLRRREGHGPCVMGVRESGIGCGEWDVR
jgi:hypothetical protein